MSLDDLFGRKNGGSAPKEMDEVDYTDYLTLEEAAQEMGLSLSAAEQLRVSCSYFGKAIDDSDFVSSSVVQMMKSIYLPNARKKMLREWTEEREAIDELGRERFQQALEDGALEVCQRYDQTYYSRDDIAYLLASDPEIESIVEEAESENWLADQCAVAVPEVGANKTVSKALSLITDHDQEEINVGLALVHATFLAWITLPETEPGRLNFEAMADIVQKPVDRVHPLIMQACRAGLLNRPNLNLKGKYQRGHSGFHVITYGSVQEVALAKGIVLVKGESYDMNDLAARFMLTPGAEEVVSKLRAVPQNKSCGPKAYAKRVKTLAW